jgi:Cu/Ag efflux protein CusF
MVPMTRLFAVLAALLLVVSVAAAAGNEVQGKVKMWDAASNTLTLEDGTQISVPADVKVERDQLKAGANVKASYDDKDGKKTATSLEVTK